MTPFSFSRRDFLRNSALGFGSLALAGLCAQQAGAITTASAPLAPKMPHFNGRAKRIIFLYMWGGPSQMDLFDPKPRLKQDDGKMGDEKRKRLYKGSRFNFGRHGQSGVEISELLPHLAQHADNLCFIRSMQTDSANHSNASLCLHTGSANFVRPSVGSWVVYGLGSENESLPGFITIRPMRSLGSRLHSNAFLPAVCQGTPVGHDGVSAKQATIRYLSNNDQNISQQRTQLELVQSLNRDFQTRTAATPEMEGLIQSFELAFRMQTEAPRFFDLSNEPENILKMYGADKEPTAEYARQCILARRFAEAGVRFIQINESGWDHHGSIDSGLPKSCARVDQPIAALLQDLKNRGMLDDTLVLFGGEFGRTATGEGEGDKAGRDHNADAFTVWMAGGGAKGGCAHGVTDDYGATAVQDRVHVHDLHATILHLLGLNHEKLTYRYAGRDFRLTDVYGNVVNEVLA